jgi:hypothetical protein
MMEMLVGAPALFANEKVAGDPMPAPDIATE